MKLILAILFAFLALSMGFRNKLNNHMFMQTTGDWEDPCDQAQHDDCESWHANDVCFVPYSTNPNPCIGCGTSACDPAHKGN
jgi:hypothetical protein